MNKIIVTCSLVVALFTGCLATTPPVAVQPETEVIPTSLVEKSLRMQAHGAHIPGVAPLPKRAGNKADENKQATTTSHTVPTTSDTANVQLSGAAPAPCTHLHYRNPVVDRIRIPGGIRGGVYIPTHDEYVVIHPGRWQVIAPSAHLPIEMPPTPLPCHLPDEGGHK